MDYRHMTAPCGLDCFNCPMYLASQNEEMRQKIAAQMNLDPELAQCQGCRNEGGVIRFMAEQPCRTYKCAQKRGHDFCFECDSFPCALLHPFADRAALLPHNTKVFNLVLISKMGLEEWAKKKAGKVKKTYFKGNVDWLAPKSSK